MKLPQRQVDDPRAQENFQKIEGLLFSPGDLKPTMAATAPAGWLLAQGQTLNTVDYPDLGRAMAATGATFTVPDLRGRVPMGAGTAVGAAGATAHALGSVGGEEAHTLSVAEMPSHGHTIGGTTVAIVNSVAGPNQSIAKTGASYGLAALDNTGGGGTHNTLPPFTAVNWLIRT